MLFIISFTISFFVNGWDGMGLGFVSLLLLLDSPIGLLGTLLVYGIQKLWNWGYNLYLNKKL